MFYGHSSPPVYAWNSSPIDGTGIFCSVTAIGRELRFTLDIDLSDLPTIVSNNTKPVVSYLRLTDSNRYFACSILKTLVEDRLSVHAERINTNRNIVTMLPGDLVMDRTTVQSDKANNKYPKFATQCEIPFKLFVAQIAVAISFINWTGPIVPN